MHARWAILYSIFPRLYFSMVFSCLIAIFCHTIQSGAPCLQIGKFFKFAIQLANEISLHRGNIEASCQKPWQHNIAGTFCRTNVWMDKFPLMGPEPVMAQRTRNYMLHIYLWALKSASSCWPEEKTKSRSCSTCKSWLLGFQARLARSKSLTIGLMGSSCNSAQSCGHAPAHFLTSSQGSMETYICMTCMHACVLCMKKRVSWQTFYFHIQTGEENHWNVAMLKRNGPHFTKQWALIGLRIWLARLPVCWQMQLWKRQHGFELLDRIRGVGAIPFLLPTEHIENKKTFWKGGPKFGWVLPKGELNKVESRYVWRDLKGYIMILLRSLIARQPFSYHISVPLSLSLFWTFFHHTHLSVSYHGQNLLITLHSGCYHDELSAHTCMIYMVI